MGVLTGEPGPGQGQPGGHRGGPGGLQIGGEPGQQPVVAGQLGAEGPAGREIVFCCLAERVHDAFPGQGCARARSAARSTLA
jgi:hypothetical protein